MSLIKEKLQSILAIGENNILKTEFEFFLINPFTKFNPITIQVIPKGKIVIAR